MHFIRIIVPTLFACTAVWAQPVTPRTAGGDAPAPVNVEGATRRSELKAVLRTNELEARSGNGVLDATQRQQLRRQLREQSGK